MKVLKKVALGLIGCVALLGLGTVAFHAPTERSRIEHAQKDHDASCVRWRAAHNGNDEGVCRPWTTNTKRLEWKTPLNHVKEARANLKAQNDAEAIANLRLALNGASDLDRVGTPIASLFAAKITTDVLDVIDANDLPPRDVVLLLRGRHLRSAERPLEAERLRAGSSFLSMSIATPRATRPFSKVLASDAIEEENRVTEAMTRAIRRGDVNACVKESQKRGITSKVAIGDIFCAKLVNVVRVDERLDRTLKRTERTAELLRLTRERSNVKTRG